jgi:hypothetical protein
VSEVKTLGHEINESNLCSSFYRPAAYALAQVVVDVPLVFIQVLLFDVVVYLYALPTK